MAGRAPGPKYPDRYDTVGPNYDKWGEQEGYTYDPATDKYKPNQPQTGAPQQQGGKTNAAGLIGLGKHALDAIGSAAIMTEAEKAAALEGLMAGPVAAPVEGGVVIGPTASPVSLSGIGGAGNVILPAAGAIGAYDLLRRDFKKNGAGYLRGVGQGAASGAALGSFFGPPGAAIGGGIGGLVGLGKVAFGHKSTKDYQAERRKALIDKGVTGYADYANQAMLGDEEYWKLHEGQRQNSAGARTDIPDDFTGYDTEGKFGHKGRWYNEAYATTGDMKYLKPEDVWGQEGMFTTFGDDWLGKYSEDERRRISQRLLDEGLLESNKGDIIIHSRNQDRARQLRDEVLGIKPEDEEEEKRGSGAAPLDNPIV